MINYLFESSCILIGMYIFYGAILEKDFFFQRNRFFLLGTTLLAFLLPFCEWNWVNVADQQTSYTFVQTLKLDKLFDLDNVKNNQFYIAENEIENNLNFFKICWYLYFFVCLFLVLRLIYQILYILFWVNSSKKNYQRGYVRIDTDGKMPTFSFFNFLFWDNTQNLTSEEKDQILHHEQKHIWDRHSYDIIFIEIAKIIWWFNPIIYLIYKDLRMQHEYLADASVLRESSIKKYAKTLVKIVFQRNNLPLAHSFNQQEIKSRLLVMQEQEKWQELDILTESNTNSFQKNKDFYKILWVIPLVLVFFWAFAGEIRADFKIENRFVNVEGGLDNFYKTFKDEFLAIKNKNLKHWKSSKTPQEFENLSKELKNIAQKNERIFVEFAVNRNGKLSDFRVLPQKNSTLNILYEDLILETLKNMNQKNTVKWLPAKIQGNLVKQKIMLPLEKL